MLSASWPYVSEHVELSCTQTPMQGYAELRQDRPHDNQSLKLVTGVLLEQREGCPPCRCEPQTVSLVQRHLKKSTLCSEVSRRANTRRRTKPPAQTLKPEEPTDDVAEGAIPDEPTTPRPPVLPEASTDQLSTSVPLTSQLEEIDEIYEALVEPIFAEYFLDVPEQNTETLPSLVIRDEEHGGNSRQRVGENEADRVEDSEPASKGWPRIASRMH